MRRILIRYANCRIFGMDTIECDENPSIITPDYANSLCFIPDMFLGESSREEVVS